MHMVVALHEISNAVAVQAGDESILSRCILGGIAAEEGIRMVLGNKTFVAEDKCVCISRFA